MPPGMNGDLSTAQRTHGNHTSKLTTHHLQFPSNAAVRNPISQSHYKIGTVLRTILRNFNGKTVVLGHTVYINGQFTVLF